VFARNAFGLSTTGSNTVSVLAALTPSKPNAPTTTVTGSTVTITWAAPNDNGNAIQGYII